MKKRMYWSLCLTSIGVVLLTVVLTLWSIYGILLRQARSDLVDEHKLISRSISFAQPNAVEYLSQLDIRFDSFRITLVLDNGEVLFDSDNDPNHMENHLQRPEIAQAFAEGRGEDVRKSETMGLDTIYYAARLDDGSVLRVSRQTRSVGAVFFSSIPVVGFIVLLILLSSMVLSSRLTKRLLHPIEGLAENMGGDADLNGYEELEPFFIKIREQNRMIQEQMEHLRGERDTIKTITSNMKEGLILLDLNKSILSVNRSAQELLQVAEADYEGKNILNLSRNVEFAGCIDAALSGQCADMMIEREDCCCQIFVSPVYNGGSICGAITLLLDVTERQQAEKIRRDFSANVSHELKTPLTSISGFAEMIEQGMVGNAEDIKKFAGRIYREASRLITLTDDIIRLSRIEDKGVTDTEPLELRGICENAAASLRYTAEQKQVVLNVSGERTGIIGNARMIDELVTNLMENAVKYNRTGGRVDVSVKRDGTDVLLAVADTGIGIPKEHQQRIFERFYRVDKSRSKQTGGTGLGLSIVKHIVERHGGTILLESALDAGTSITVRLPSEP